MLKHTKAVTKSCKWKDIQYNVQKKRDKQWFTKHYTEKRSSTI